jgi:hypothetical protein
MEINERKNPAELPVRQVEQRGRNREEAMKVRVDINPAVREVKEKKWEK